MCRRLIAEHSKSFALASRLYPAPQRADVSAVYAWCRLCDDAIDLAPVHEHDSRLRRLEEELRSVHAGESQTSPVLRCFQDVVRRHEIPAEYTAELLLGMRMDVEGRAYPFVDDLLLYCHRVAGCVGLILCHLMGVSSASALRHAAHLGIAMQLGNIARDVLEDARRGRIYLPGEWLGPGTRAWLEQAADDTVRAAQDPSPPPEVDREVRRAVGALLDLSDRYYASGDRGLRFLTPRSALAVDAARRVYAEIGVEIRRRHCAVLSGRVVVGRTRKLALLAGAIARFASDVGSRERRSLDVSAPARSLSAGEAVVL